MTERKSKREAVRMLESRMRMAYAVRKIFRLAKRINLSIYASDPCMGLLKIYDGWDALRHYAFPCKHTFDDGGAVFISNPSYIIKNNFRITAASHARIDAKIIWLPSKKHDTGESKA